jgi:hypothetical protein
VKKIDISCIDLYAPYYTVIMIFTFIIILINLVFITYPHLRLLVYMYEPHVGGIYIGNTTDEQQIISKYHHVYPVANITIDKNPENVCSTKQLVM